MDQLLWLETIKVDDGEDGCQGARLRQRSYDTRYDSTYSNMSYELLTSQSLCALSPRGSTSNNCRTTFQLDPYCSTKSFSWLLEAIHVQQNPSHARHLDSRVTKLRTCPLSSPQQLMTGWDLRFYVVSSCISSLIAHRSSLISAKSYWLYPYSTLQQSTSSCFTTLGS